MRGGRCPDRRKRQRGPAGRTRGRRLNAHTPPMIYWPMQIRAAFLLAVWASRGGSKLSRQRRRKQKRGAVCGGSRGRRRRGGRGAEGTAGGRAAGCPADARRALPLSDPPTDPANPITATPRGSGRRGLGRRCRWGGAGGNGSFRDRNTRKSVIQCCTGAAEFK